MSTPNELRPIKIVVTGVLKAGKSTTISKIAESAISIDKWRTTVGLDYGYTQVGIYEIHVFGTPGHDRFSFMREILGKGAAGIMLVVDSTRPEFFDKAVEMLDQIGVNAPCVVLANKQDLPGALPPEKVKEELVKLGLSPETPVIGTVATRGEGVKEALQKLLEMITKPKEAGGREAVSRPSLFGVRKLLRS